MGSVQREVLRDEVAFTDEVLLLDRDRPKVIVDGAQDVFPEAAAHRQNGLGGRIPLARTGVARFPGAPACRAVWQTGSGSGFSDLAKIIHWV